ncbi:S-adenosyl-L-methionine-dependent methyltransferase [Xylaria intraflava]|nr:S-adenosyl-L-methionine-dependent methyltransferase [Xylaria intraflava]
MSKSRVARTLEALRGLLDPWLFIAVSASFIPGTIRHIAQTQGTLACLRTLASPASFRAVWFGQFWNFAGPGIRETGGPRVLALLDGRTTRGNVVDAPTGPGVGGVVIEIGAGSGLWVDLYSKKHLYEDTSATTTTSNGTEPSPEVRQRRFGGGKRSNTARTEITHVFGVEPNISQHAALRRAVKNADLDGIYEIVPVGIEDLSSNQGNWDGKIEPGSVDCIVSVLCLCSIPDPEYNIRELYKLLRPGGRWYVYEHVKAEYNWFMRFYQGIVNVFWPYFAGGCNLRRSTEKTLREAGPWTSIDLAQPVVEPWFHSVPHIMGVLTK